jgi:hypothetical protein
MKEWQCATKPLIIQAYEINRSDQTVLTGKVNDCIFVFNTGRQTRIKFAIPVPARYLP